MKTCIVVQCRYDSSRLPGKILKNVGKGETSLSFLLNRLEAAKLPIIVATTDREEDDQLARYVEGSTYIKSDPKLFRGSYENVAKRIYDASEGYDFIIRVTGDDIFVDIEIMRDTLKTAIKMNYDYIYQPGLIRGFDCEVIRREALKKIVDKYDKVEHIEHYFKTNEFNVGKLDCCAYLKRDNISLTIDTAEDFKLATEVIEKLDDFNAPAYYIIDVVLSYNLHNINRKPKVSIYMVYKDLNQLHLAAALKCVNNQILLDDCEFIFVDYSKDIDNSKAAYELLRNYEISNLKNFRDLKIPNFIEAIKFAISKCSAKYVIRADADDEMSQDAVIQLYNYAVTHDSSIVIPNYTVGRYWVPGCDNNLTCHALVEKKKYDYIKYIENQEFRDGTSLILTFQKFGFPIDYLDKILFYHREREDSLTSDDEKVKIMDEQIKQFIISQ